MNSRAYAETDPMFLGVRIAVRRPTLDGGGTVLTWAQPDAKMVTEGGTQLDDNVWLRLHEDDARAMYEALAAHFGGTGHDTRALRKDYDAERARVDRLIGHLTSSP